MKYDSNTPESEMLWELGDYRYGGYSEDAINEFRRRSNLAAKYERLTRALVLVSSGDIEVFIQEVWAHHLDGQPARVYPHHQTPDSIADAIIAAAEEVK